MDMKKADRPLSSQAYSQLLYQDDHDEVLKICQESGREPTEEIRDLLSKALDARRGRSAYGNELLQALERLFEQNRLLIQQNQLVNERYERLLKKSEALEDRWDSLKRGLIQNLREFYAILLETLSASIGARNLAWNYVARVILDKSGFTKEQIERRYDDERKTWIQERENIAEELERAVKTIPSEGFDEGDLAGFDHDLRLKTPGSHGS
jgi:hypothetical protein